MPTLNSFKNTLKKQRPNVFALSHFANFVVFTFLISSEHIVAVDRSIAFTKGCPIKIAVCI